MKPPVLVTGATGFIGGALTRALLAQGREVRALVRNPSGAELVRRLGARPVRGDLGDRKSLVEASQGASVLYHAAGVNTLCPRDPEMIRVNVEGTRNVVAAAAEAGIGRIIYTSSATVLGEAKNHRSGEEEPHRGWFLSQYERSKYLTEKAAFAEAEGTGIELVALNPSSVQGPGRKGGTARIILAYASGKLRFMVPTRVSFVDVDDCTEAHLLAETRGEAGRRYVISGVSASSGELIDLIARVTGIHHRVLWLPPSLLPPAAAAVEGLARVFGFDPPLCRDMARTLIHGHAYDGSRAERELGLKYTPVEETIRKTLDYYRAQGLLSPN